MPSLRSTLPSGAARAGRRPITTLLCWLLALCAALTSTLTPQAVYAAPALILPTSPGEQWRIIQGYACGTHNSWDRYSLDLVQVNGPTYNAPVRAAASGEVWHWEGSSGTLILHHGNRFFTMYTHLARAVTTGRGKYFKAGETLGFAGDRGSPGVPHLHFTAFTANRDGWSGKASIPLRFTEGYDFPEIGGCNQHGGKVVTAMALQPPQISFKSEAEPGRWYRTDQRVEFTTAWAGGGLSQAWDKEPAPESPMFPSAVDGYAQLAEQGEGMRTLFVRVWGPDGKQTVASFGPVGLDTTPPTPPAPITDLTAPPGAMAIQWAPATDALSGVAGYRVYIGADPAGEADWFTPEPSVTTDPLTPGQYVVRVQTLDSAGNTSPWATLGALEIAAAAP